MFVNSRLNGFLPWLLIAWVVTITTRYVSTILKSLQHPYNPGDEAIFVIVWLGVVVAIFVTLAIHQRLAAIMWCVLIFSAIVTISVLSRAWPAVLIAIWIAAVVTLLGRSILSLLHLST